MEFIVAKIEKKEKYPRNIFHGPMIGRECDITHLVVGEVGKLVVDMLYDPGNPHRIHTSLIQRIMNQDDGTIVFETENSVYTLVPMKKEG